MRMIVILLQKFGHDILNVGWLGEMKHISTSVKLALMPSLVESEEDTLTGI